MEFHDWTDYIGFADYVKNTARHFWDSDQSAFLDAVAKTAKKRLHLLGADTILWRAQVGFERDEEFIDDKDHQLGTYPIDVPFPSMRMKPETDRATEGRANPKGIPYLYLATDEHTAMSEMRGWLGAQISLARFKVRRDVRLVDCTVDSNVVLPKGFGVPRPEGEEKEKCVWKMINDAFSEPITQNDNVADYAPTQVLAERFKTVGYDGVRYSSKIGSGSSIALFDLGYATVVDRQLFRVDHISYEFKASSAVYT